MDTILSPPERHISLADGFVQSKETTILMRCHDRLFRDVEVFDESDEVLFTVWSPPILNSASWRRVIKDVTGTPILQLRRNISTMRMFECKWIVQNSEGHEICYMHRSSIFNQWSFDVRISSKEREDETIVEVRPKDQHGLTTLVIIGGSLVAEICMKEVNIQRQYDRSVWTARIANGVDLSLMVAIMLCRAEVLHVSNK